VICAFLYFLDWPGSYWFTSFGSLVHTQPHNQVNVFWDPPSLICLQPVDACSWLKCFGLSLWAVTQQLVWLTLHTIVVSRLYKIKGRNCKISWGLGWNLQGCILHILLAKACHRLVHIKGSTTWLGSNKISFPENLIQFMAVMFFLYLLGRI
jgi:hypothetical protein